MLRRRRDEGAGKVQMVRDHLDVCVPRRRQVRDGDQYGVFDAG